jgi:hypothetical protein
VMTLRKWSEPRLYEPIIGRVSIMAVVDAKDVLMKSSGRFGHVVTPNFPLRHNRLYISLFD